MSESNEKAADTTATSNTSNNAPNNNIIQEESWAEHAKFAAEYTSHSSQHIPLLLLHKKNASIHIQSVDPSNMTLLDVCNYVPDDQVDGSGHCVWMGALFLIHSLAISSSISSTTTRTTTSSSSSNCWKFLQNKTICEFGCGTGAAGIGLLKLCELQNKHEQSSEGRGGTAKVIFSDNDHQALSLCRTNCHNNHLPEHCFDIMHQESWVDIAAGNAPPLSNDTATAIGSSIDTILATDVLYDLKIIRPFWETAAKVLDMNDSSHKKHKHLILSHVPRWFLPKEDDKSKSKKDTELEHSPALELEQFIVQQANECGFHLVQTVRPNNLLEAIAECGSEALSAEEEKKLRSELKEMEQAGAVLLVFERGTEDAD